MKVRIAIITCGFSLLLLFAASATKADRRLLCDQTCPLCNHKFQAELAISGTQFGQRLDLRPVGPIASPLPLAVCPKCGFVLHKGDDEKYTDEELKTFRKLVASKEYKKLGPTDPAYLRLAKLYEGLSSSPRTIAHTYLKASWQVEADRKRNRALMEKSLEWFEKFLASSPPQDEHWRAAEFLRGEFLRRLERFDDAKKQFERLAGMKQFKSEPFSRLIAQEQELIRAKDASPQEIQSEKKKK